MEPRPSAREPGMRLHRFELHNWGTFDQDVWILDVGGGNCLVTGQVGAGKSTLIDGLSLLFNPPGRVSFNLAAGAAKTERSLRTYVLGAHRTVIDDSIGGQRAQYLRKPANARSALLAVFGTNTGQRVSIGMWLRFTNEAAQPEWHYLIAHDDLSISADLTGHKDTRGLRQHLRSRGATVYDNYTKYGIDLRKDLGLASLSALSLLNRTVAMKSVTDITGFVRQDMLDAPDTESAITQMLAHYSDLTKAHDLVTDARRQIDALREIENRSAELDRIDTRITANRDAEGAVRDLVNQVRVKLLRARADELDALIPSLRGDHTAAKDALERMRGEITDLEKRLNDAGGADLQLAERNVADAQNTIDHVRKERAALESDARTAEIAPPDGAADFPRFLRDRRRTTEQLLEQRQAALQRGGELVSARTHAQQALDDLDKEIRDSFEHTSNIPRSHAAIRDRLADELNLKPTDLPFVGELLTVADEQSEWEPAIERLLRPFALSLLVPDEQRERVAAAIDTRHLGLKLVYYPVPSDQATTGRPHEGTVAAKLQVRHRTRYTNWLTAQLTRRFGHVCVTSAADLSRHERAITRHGQVRDGIRREKDDSRRAGDRRDYVLGWDTTRRREALLDARPALHGALEQAKTGLAEHSELDSRRRRVEGAVARLDRYNNYAAIDFAAAQTELERAQRLYETLLQNPELARISGELGSSKQRVEAKDQEADRLARKLGANEADARRTREQLEGLGTPEVRIAGTALELLNESVRTVAAPPKLMAEPDTIDDCQEWEDAIRESLVQRSRSLQGSRKKTADELVGHMSAYGNTWPQHTADIATNREDSRSELLQRLATLVEDDLPRFEQDFRRQLEENAINNVAVFARNLERKTEDIQDRIGAINQALADVDYQQGTYITLTQEPTKDLAVREFRRQLRDVTSEVTLDPYSEERFLAVRNLLDRFAGRPDHTIEDQRWTSRVADVRNWFTFAAQERSRDEDTVVEHYSDSDGKSGGQKERLAYTILAASLAYQYGLAEGKDTQAFRFAMIDEAFGRASDDSTRFGLEMFRRLGLQLLVVTPKQKIATISPYVEAVGVVDQRNDRSRLLSMTIQEFRQRVGNK